MNEQITLFDMTRKPYQINKPIRLIELFAGYGSQAMALRNIGADFEHYRVVEFDKYAIASYNAIHGTDFPTIDIKDVTGADLGIVDKDKYCYLMVYSFPCGLAGTKIKTSDGYKNIEDVKTGESVLTHKNRYMKVVKTMTRKCPDYYKIQVLGCPELQLTSEHPLYVMRNNEIQWIKVRELTQKDMVCFNINTESIPTKCSDKVLWLLGRYAADGHINKYSYNSVNFSIAFNKEEEFLKHIPDEMLGKFKRFKKSCWDYRIADPDFQDLCFEIGNGSCNKQVPQWIQDLPAEQARCFLDGYMSGDGHCRKEKNLYMFSTASKELFLGIQNLIMKIYGFVCSCYKRTDNRKKTFNDTYNAQYSITNSSMWQKKIGDQIFTAVRKIEHIEKEVDVYNFEVDEDNSYTCENVIVHNCTDISIAGRQAGFEENSGTRSSLLWEVKRILNELKELGSLPDVLLMENVIAIHQEKNVKHFRKWIDFLDSLGYSNYVEDLNAADYGIPQHRERTFMVSILGEYNYKFPHPIELTTCLEDYFEDLTEEEAMKQIVKSSKAMDLLVKLDEENKLD